MEATVPSTYPNTEQQAVRTTNMPAPTSQAPQHGYGVNPNSNDDNVVSSSSLEGTGKNAYSEQEDTEPHSTHDSKHSAAPANGDHIAMETDVCEEPQSSCDDSALRHRQTDCQGAGVLPRLTSPHTQYNHVPFRTSQSSDGTFQEATDASSEAWSPSNQSKTSGMVSEEDHREADKYRTDSKGGLDRLQNGLLSKQYDVPETEIAN
jgi:hypothetical protein